MHWNILRMWYLGTAINDHAIRGQDRLQRWLKESSELPHPLYVIIYRSARTLANMPISVVLCFSIVNKLLFT